MRSIDCRQFPVFKRQSEVINETVLNKTIYKTGAVKQLEEARTAKKREHTTKQLIVPAGTFLKCVAQRNRAKYPVSLSLRFPGGGVSWSVSNQTELLLLSYSDEVKRANLIYMRHIHDIVYIDICRNGRLTVDNNCLPGVHHLGVLSETEVLQFWETRKAA